MTATLSRPPESPDHAFDALSATLLESLTWGAFLALLYFYVPKSKSVFADFGLEVSDAGLLVISASDFFVNYAYGLIPAGLALLFAINAFAFGTIRSLWGRVLWTSLMAIIPLLLGTGTIAILQGLMNRLASELN